MKNINYLSSNKLLEYSLLIWAFSTLTFMAGMSIGCAVFSIVVLIHIIVKKNNTYNLLSNNFFYATLLFILTIIISIACAHISPPLGLPLQSFSGISKLHYFLLPFFIPIALLSSKNDLEIHPIWKTIFFTAFIVSVVGILQFWASYIFPNPWLQSKFFRVIATSEKINLYHAQGFMYFHLSYATAMGFIVSYVAARVFWPLETDSSKDKILFLLLLLATSLALFFSFSRIAWVSLACVFLFLSFLKRPKYFLYTSLVLAIFFIFSWYFLSGFRGRWILGLVTLFEREGVWAASLGMIKDRFLTGVGFSKTGYYSPYYAEIALGEKPLFTSHAHNNFLDIFASLGILGFFAYIFWWVVLWKYAWTDFKNSPSTKKWLPAACLAGFVAFHINGLTQVNFFDGKSQHSLMLWAGIVLTLYLRKSKSTQ